MTDTMQRPDVNQAFYETRREQIEYNSPENIAARNAERQATFDKRVAEGKLRNLGGGRYKVDEPGSWDNGEILYLRTETYNGVEQRIIMPETGLDTTTGTAALYAHTGLPIWHEEGNQLPEALDDIDQVMELAGLTYGVRKMPVLYRNPKNGTLEELPGQFVTARDDVESNAGMGVVGRIWNGWQNLENFQFLMELVQKYKVKWDSAGALRGGAKTFVSMRLPLEIRIDADGIDDTIVPFLIALNDHSGQGALDLITSPWRPVCGNTERFARRDLITKWSARHTKNIWTKVDEARRGLKLSFAYYETWESEEQLLARTELKNAGYERLLKDLFKEPKEGAKKAAVTRHQNRADTLMQLWAGNSAKLGRTAYAGERALTEYFDWHTDLRPSGPNKGRFAAARATAVVEGAYDKQKSRVHKRMMALAQR